MRTLQEKMCLTRPNFSINPKQSFEDAKLFFGESLNVDIIQQIETGYLAGYIPRFYLYGNYGTGKTHLLYHLKHYFDSDTGPVKVRAFVTQLEASTGSRFQSLHRKLLDAVGMQAVKDAYLRYVSSVAGDQDRVREIFPEPNTFLAMQLFLTGQTVLAWRWLTGERLSNAELANLGVTSNLTETGELVDVLVHVGELFKRNGENLFFMVDESEALRSVTNADAQRTWHDALRRLADHQDNQSIGWLLTFYTTLADDPPGFVMEADITSRLGREGQRRLEPLAPVEVKRFLRDLLDAFVDKSCAKQRISDENLATTEEWYPFTQEGFEQFVAHAQATPDQAIPRILLRAVTALGLHALRNDLAVFDDRVVDEVVPQEFSDVI